MKKSEVKMNKIDIKYQKLNGDEMKINEFECPDKTIMDILSVPSLNPLDVILDFYEYYLGEKFPNLTIDEKSKYMEIKKIEIKKRIEDLKNGKN